MSNVKFPFTTDVVIDCDPWTGMGRQANHFAVICKILNIEYKEPVSKCFGAWTWTNVTYQTKEQRDQVGNFLKELYNSNRIRYAEW